MIDEWWAVLGPDTAVCCRRLFGGLARGPADTSEVTPSDFTAHPDFRAVVRPHLSEPIEIFQPSFFTSSSRARLDLPAVGHRAKTPTRMQLIT